MPGPPCSPAPSGDAGALLALAYPDAHCELDHRNAFELAVATVLSAQCTDKRDLAFRPLETALEKGIIDAMYMQTKPLQQVSEATGKFAAIEDLSRYPDWRLQVANIPAAITCTDVMAKEHPELAVTFMKGMIRAGRWANTNKRAAAEILDQQTFYRDIEHTYQGIRDVDLVPNLSPLNLAAVEVGKNFMLRHGYIKNDFDVNEWAAPEFLEQAARELLEDQWQKTTKSKLPSAAAALASPGRIG